ncbi:NAD(P)/FAD-dependent oxidoreductase [Telmatospirillum sp. J64-1]|uniref:NAD(P)/FAD-dependent oxidoreductase n=1 Tax=Telmatospirillum sp. J64-1 TaxID=2502183 RepID=UPI00115EFAE2|nr:FAD-dependent oxidoreductase [Telmatospirillum sp. J64-1]
MSIPGTILVLGGGLAAVSTCAGLREAGYEGRIVLVGDEDVAPYDRPPLSKQVLSGEMDAAACLLHPSDFYRDKEIELELGLRAEGIDPQARRVVLSDGRGLSYDRLMIATGGSARRLSLGRPGLRGVHALRGLGDALALKDEMLPGRCLVVIGGGFLGLEVAASAQALGLEVVVLEAAGELLRERVAPAVGAWLLEMHRRQGVRIETGAQVAGYVGETGLEAVTLADGRRIGCDLCVEAIGIHPESGLARSAGLAWDEGILVDAEGRTSLPDIFAAGDVARLFDPRYGRALRLESWQSAQQQGAAAARTMLGLSVPEPDVPWFWSSQHGHMMHMAGLPGEGQRMVLRGDPETGRFTLFGIRAGRVESLFSVNSMADARVGKSLIAQARLVDSDILADTGVKLRGLIKAPAL